jgi:agmatinase
MHDFDPDGPGSAEDGLFGVPADPAEAAVVVIPVPLEATTSFRRGTRDGPAAVLEASTQLDLSDLETGEPWRAGIAMLPIPEEVRAWDRKAEADALAVIEAGGAVGPTLHAAVERVNAMGEEVNRWVYERAVQILDRGAVPAVLGGDHASPFGCLQAVSERFPGVGVLHIDAHADLREAYEGFTWSHASILFNVLKHLEVGHLVQVGLRDVGHAERAFIDAQRGRVSAWFDPEIAWALAGGEAWLALAERIVAPLPARVYVSFDIDGLDPALCPNTGTPVPGGLSWQQACALLRVLAESGREIVGFDLCEVAPGPGPAAESWDANVGARLLYKLAGWAVRTRGAAGRS